MEQGCSRKMLGIEKMYLKSVIPPGTTHQYESANKLMSTCSFYSDEHKWKKCVSDKHRSDSAPTSLK
jgi:hypothetical protein